MYAENCKTLMKEIKHDINRWRDISCSWMVVLVVKNLPDNGREKCKFSPWVRKISWRRTWQPISVILPGESYGQWTLAGYSQEGHKKSNKTEVT